MGVEKTIQLYWVTVPDDPSEDWFVFAIDVRSARKFFASFEDFDTRDTEAILVQENVCLKKLENGDPPCWTKLSDLEALGFEILTRPPSPRSVRRDSL